MRSRSTAFTLVELLIVVMILGILAGVVLQSFQASTLEAEETQARATLQLVRDAIDRYRAEHDGTFPGYPNGGGGPTQARFRRHLYRLSRESGQTAVVGTSGYPLGPYLREPYAVNPLNQKSTVRVVDDGLPLPAPDDGRGWIYKAETGEFRMNSTGTAPSGTPWFDL